MHHPLLKRINIRLSKLKNFESDSNLKEKFNKIVVFYSDNDNKNIIESANQIHARLGSKLIHIKGKGHFCYEDMGSEIFLE